MSDRLSAIIRNGKVFILDGKKSKTFDELDTNFDVKTVKILDDHIFLISTSDKLFMVDRENKIIPIFPEINIHDLCYEHDDLHIINTGGTLFYCGGVFGNTKMFEPLNPLIRFKQIYRCFSQLMAIDVSGNLWCDFDTHERFFGKLRIPDPHQLLKLTQDIYFVTLSMRAYRIVAVDNHGSVYISFAHQGIKRLDTKNIKFRYVASGRRHTSLIDTNNNLWMFEKDSLTFKFNRTNVDELACGAYYTLVKFENGDIALSKDRFSGYGELNVVPGLSNIQRLFNQIP